MREPARDVETGYIALWFFRTLRALFYRFMGTFRPGWRDALPLVRDLERKADQATMNPQLYMDPTFGFELRNMEAEIKRVRARR